MQVLQCRRVRMQARLVLLLLLVVVMMMKIAWRQAVRLDVRVVHWARILLLLLLLCVNELVRSQ